jgi:hypothetical protein
VRLYSGSARLADNENKVGFAMTAVIGALPYKGFFWKNIFGIKVCVHLNSAQIHPVFFDIQLI